MGVDVVNDYYDPQLKEARLRALDYTAARMGADYQFIRADLADLRVVSDCFSRHKFDRVIHLAAQPGVRYSLVNPHAYVQSNIVAFTNVLEGCRHAKVPHLTYASSSSVYGANKAMPFRESADVGHPLQFYAATKRANELMAHCYSHLFALPTTGLRFFTVYGPWGRPDMAYFQFTKAIIDATPIKIFAHGNQTRDFTYVDDIVEGVIRASDDVATRNPHWDGVDPDPSTSNAPFRIFNIGNSSPVPLLEYIEAIENAIGKKAVRQLIEEQPGDVSDTFADVSALVAQVNYMPITPVSEGVMRFVAWYREYHGV